MPAPAIKAIILSVSLVTALGLAIYESPEVQRWLEEQRTRLLELIRNIGAELDPQTRREAEAFATGGYSPLNDVGLRREVEASREARALATGSSLGNGSSIRRTTLPGPESEQNAEERRRLGREYLAQRNQTLYEMRERRKRDGVVMSTSFDAMVDVEGKLKTPGKELPEVPFAEPKEEDTMEGVVEAAAPIMIAEAAVPAEASGTASGMSGWGSIGWHMGSRLADPFSDDFALDRSSTPKPPVPPKIELEQPVLVPAPTPVLADEPPAQPEELSYEEQLAIALSLSEADSSGPLSTVRQAPARNPDADLHAAIEASLLDMDYNQATRTIVKDTVFTPPVQPLVDLTPDLSVWLPQDLSQNHREGFFERPHRTAQQSLDFAPPRPVEDEDDLYGMTPQLTHARLADLNASNAGPAYPYDPVRDVVGTQDPPEQPIDASFYSAHSRSATPQVSQQLAQVLTPPAQHGSADETASEPVASPSTSRTQSVARSEISLVQAPSEVSDIEVIDVEEDSDEGVLSSGIATPDSWSEVGGSEAESEAGRELV